MDPWDRPDALSLIGAKEEVPDLSDPASWYKPWYAEDVPEAALPSSDPWDRPDALSLIGGGGEEYLKVPELGGASIPVGRFKGTSKEEVIASFKTAQEIAKKRHPELWRGEQRSMKDVAGWYKPYYAEEMSQEEKERPYTEPGELRWFQGSGPKWTGKRLGQPDPRVPDPTPLVSEYQRQELQRKAISDAQEELDVLVHDTQTAQFRRAAFPGKDIIRPLSPLEEEFMTDPMIEKRGVERGELGKHLIATELEPGTQIQRQRRVPELDFWDSSTFPYVNVGALYEAYGGFMGALPIIGELVQTMAKIAPRSGRFGVQAPGRLLGVQAMNSQVYHEDTRTILTDLILEIAPDPRKPWFGPRTEEQLAEDVKVAVEEEILRHHGKEMFMKFLKEGPSALPFGSAAAREIEARAGSFGDIISIVNQSPYFQNMQESEQINPEIIGLLDDVMFRAIDPEKEFQRSLEEKKALGWGDQMVPDIYPMVMNTWRNVEQVAGGAMIIAYNLPQWFLSGLPINSKLADTTDMAAHLTEYFVHRYGMLLNGNLGAFLNEGLIYAAFDLALPFQIAKGAVRAAEIRALKQAAELAGTDSLLVQRIRWAANDTELLVEARKLSAEIVEARRNLGVKEGVIAETEAGRMPWGTYIKLYEKNLTQFNEMLKEIMKIQSSGSQRGRVASSRHKEYDKTRAAYDKAKAAGNESAALGHLEHLNLIESESRVALMDRITTIEAAKVVILERLEAGKGAFSKATAEERSARAMVARIKKDIADKMRERKRTAESIRPEFVTSPKPSLSVAGKELVESALTYRAIGERISTAQSWFMPWGGTGTAIVGGLLGGELGLIGGFGLGGLTGINLLKDRLFREGSRFSKITEGLAKRYPMLRPRIGEELNVEMITSLRHYFKDPDKLIPETVWAALREAEGGIDAVIFAMGDTLKQLPKELWPEIRQFLHYEHAQVTSYFNWVDDGMGHITYSLKPEHVGNVLLETRLAHANKYAGPLATVIRKFATKEALELGMLDKGKLNRLWVHNMYDKATVESAIQSMENTILGESFRLGKLRDRGIPIEAREIPLGELIPEKIIKLAKSKEARAEMRARNKSGVGGWGMRTNLIEELFGGVVHTIHDINMFRAYRIMAKDPHIVSHVKRKGWVQFDATKVRGTDMAKYGDLAGKWVNPDYAYYIKAQAEFARIGGTVMGKGLKYWKSSKTIMSPATHATNFLSNGLILSIMADISPLNPLNWGFYAQSAKEMILGGRSALYREWVINGGKGRRSAFASGRSELVREAETIASKIHGGMIGQGKNFFGEALESYRLTAAGVKQVKGVSVPMRIYDKLGLLYQAGDDYYRFALYLKLRKRGMAPVEAAKAGRRAYADYENLSGAFQAVKNSPFGIPFISFDARMSPVVAKWMRTRPVKGILLAQTFDFIAQKNMASAGVNLEQVSAFMRNVPWYQQQGYIPWVQFSGERMRPGGKAGMFGIFKYVPGARFIPLVDEARKYTADTDADWINPGVNEWFRRSVMSSSPYWNTTLLTFGDMHPFFKKKIEGLDDEKMKYLWFLWSPNLPIVPYSWGDNRIKRAQEKRPRLGRNDVESVFQARLMTWVGIRDIDYTLQEMYMTAADESERRDMDFINTRIRNLESELLSKLQAVRRRNGSLEEFHRVRDEGALKFREILTQMAKIQEGQMKDRDLPNLKAFYDVH